jgi:hypothetical protein
LLGGDRVAVARVGRVSAGGELFLAIAEAVAVGVEDRRVGAVDVDLVAVRQPVRVGVGVCGIETGPASEASG